MAIRTFFMDKVSPVALIIFLSGIISLSASCGGDSNTDEPPGTKPPPSAGNTTEPAEVTTLISDMSVMASVTDTDGVPIRGAKVGDNGLTGTDGIVMADTQPTTSGWYRISAPGYAQEYLKPLGSYQGITAFTTRLTPVGTLQDWKLAAAAAVTLNVGDPSAPALSISLGPSAFSSDVTLSATMLEPLKTRTTLAPLDTTDPLYITQPFEIRALDANGEDLQLAAGETATITIMDNGDMGSTPRLFWFNPDTGTWEEELSAGCIRSDSTHVQCTVAHFSHHGGAGDTPPPSSPPDDPDSAQRESEQELNEWGESGGSGGMPESLLDALTNELIAAIAWANDHPSEEAKTLLINTIARLQVLGYDDYNHQDGNGIIRDTGELYDAIEGVITKLANPHIQNPQCINFEKIMNLAAQASIFGPEDIKESLFSVFHELVERCNVIQGRVEFSLVLASDIGWPGLGVYSARPRESGATYWTEYNDINLAIHVNNEGDAVEVDGNVNVETDFPLVVYRREVNNMGYCSFETFERYSYWGEPNKGQAEVTVHADGDLAGLQYSNETLSSTSSISMQHEYFDVGWEFVGSPTPVCVKADDASAIVPLWENYQGQLMEQYKEQQYLESSGEELGETFYHYLTGEQFPTVWDILDKIPDITHAGSVDSFPTRIWRGSEIIFDIGNIPSGEYGHKVIMRYDIQHIDYTKGGWVTFHQ